jgi:Putative auto-transporter adhesin, head GIN domain
MRRTEILLTVLATVLIAGCGGQSVRGSGNVITETRSVNGFKEVSLRGSGQLTVDQSGMESLTITADENLLPYLTSEVSGDRLILGTREHTNLNPSKNIVYKLTVKDLNALEVAGDGSADAKGIHTDLLKVVVAGSGSLSTAGNADEQEIMIAGSGDYRGADVRSRIVKVNIMGSGNADLNATDKLDATIMGSGDIKYTGSPIVKQNILGSGSVQKR